MENNALTSLIDRALVTDIHGANRALDNLMCDVLLPSTDCKAVHVHACCKKMHVILHGLDAGVVCVLDATARRLHINDIIVLHYENFDEVSEAYYKATVHAPEKYFAMHDDGPTLHATFDDHVQTKKPRGRYVRCHHNKAIQRLITNGAFLHNLETCDEACNEERQHLYLMQHPARIFCCARENTWHPFFTPMLDLFEVVERRAVSADYADVYSNLVVQRRT
eukprot:gene8232-9782_t